MPKKNTKQVSRVQEDEIEHNDNSEIDDQDGATHNDQEQQEQQEQNENAYQEVEQTDSVQSMPCKDFDIKRLYFRAQEPDPEATQLMCFPKYLYPDDENDYDLTPENFENHGESPIIVTDPIFMDKGGIPRYDQKYHGADKDSMKRAYFYIPKNSTSTELFKCCQMIDDYMEDEINVKQNKNAVLCILKDNKTKKRLTLKGLTYKKMITTAKPGNSMDSLVDDDEEDNKSKTKKTNDKNKKDVKDFVPWDRIKAKFSTVYDENLEPDDKKELNTQIYVGTKEEPENCKTVSDIAEHFGWKCKAQYALMFNKVWIKKGDDKTCGFGIKCVQIGITEQPEKRSSLNRQLNRRLFASSAPPANKNLQIADKSVSNTTKTSKSQILDNEEENDQEENEPENDQEENQNVNQDGDNQDDENGDDSSPESEDESKSKKITKNTKNDVKVKGKSIDRSIKTQTEKKVAPPKKGKKN